MRVISEIRKLNRDDKGLVGIGTIIVFIAIVMVAAIAAGVLIRTAEALQKQARATSEESIRQASAGVNIVSIIGRVSPNYENVENIEIVVALRPGSPAINIKEMTIEYLSPNTERLLTLGKDNWDNWMAYSNRGALEDRWGDLDENEFAIVQIIDISNTPPQIFASTGDKLEIWINVNRVDENALQVQGEVLFKLIPKVGLETFSKVMVPPSLYGRRVVHL